MKIYLLKFIMLFLSFTCLVQLGHSQSATSDSSHHPYYVNYWISGGITIVSGVANYIAIPMSSNKDKISQIEINSLNKDIISGFDRMAINQDPSKRSYYTNLSDNLLACVVVLPGFMLFDNQIRHDWLEILLMYAETQSLTNNIYEYSFLGPNFQNKFRPVVYYDAIPQDQRILGYNRSSFYSGHTASATAATFFMVKVFSDYHPEIGAYKYLLYAVASIPPLFVGYIRIKALFHFPSDVIVGYGIGALCGIVIPEFHRFKDKNISLGVYSSAYSTGIAVKWQPDFLK